MWRILFVFFAISASAEVIEFHIALGTGANSWNTQSESIYAKMDDVIRFFNDDNVVHTLHTYGTPCSHGLPIEPGASWDCVVQFPHHSSVEGPLYDHNYGITAEVWIEAE